MSHSKVIDLMAFLLRPYFLVGQGDCEAATLIRRTVESGTMSETPQVRVPQQCATTSQGSTLEQFEPSASLVSGRVNLMYAGPTPQDQRPRLHSVPSCQSSLLPAEATINRNTSG